jgi:hypothetical protein
MKSLSEIIEEVAGTTIDFSGLIINKSEIPDLTRVLKGHPTIREIVPPSSCDDFVKKRLKKIESQNKEYLKNKVSSLRNLSLFRFDDSPLKRLERSRELIRHHASQRVDLFFYTAIYFYRNSGEVKLDSTQRGAKQFGIGDQAYNTQASHSALLSNPYSKIRIPRADKQGHLNLYVRFPDDNHFHATLGSTVELPAQANIFDRLLEGNVKKEEHSIWRAKTLNILTEVSKGNLTPIQALAHFFHVLYDFFSNQNVLQRYWVDTAEPEKRLIYWEQFRGSFFGKWDTVNMATEYLANLLRLAPEESLRLSDEDFLEMKYKQLRDEILVSKTTPQRLCP